MISVADQVAAALAGDDLVERPALPESASSRLPSGYAELPVSIKQYLSPKEFLWLSDADKASLVMDSTEPDHDL